MCTVNVMAYSEIKDSVFRCWQEANDDVFRVQLVKDGDIYPFLSAE